MGQRVASYRQVAVALKYDADKDAVPRVVAKGSGYVAERIIDLARQHGVPIRTDADLAQALAQIDVGRVIPAELYPAVAEVLAYIYRMNNRRAPV